MDGLPQTSLFLGIIPALVLLYISIKGYEGLYKEKIIFLTFISGIIAGFLSVIIETFTAQIGFIFIILFPLLEQLFKTIILNIRRFHRKGETTIYGLSLGLGFGSIFIPFSLFLTNFQSGNNILIMTFSILGSFGIILLHATTGICIGFGVYIGKLSRYFILAIILHLPVTITIFLTSFLQIPYIQILLIPYGLIIYWFGTIKLMAQILRNRKYRKRS